MLPRHVASVELVGDSAGVHITWHLGEVVAAAAVQTSTYSVVVTGNRGSFVRTFSVRFDGTEDPGVVTWVHELMLAARGPSRADEVRVTSDSISVQFVGAGLGPEPYDNAYGDLQVNSVFVQQRLPVSVIQG
jgi:hypothetical protein